MRVCVDRSCPLGRGEVRSRRHSTGCLRSPLSAILPRAVAFRFRCSVFCCCVTVTDGVTTSQPRDGAPPRYDLKIMNRFFRDEDFFFKPRLEFFKQEFQK